MTVTSAKFRLATEEEVREKKGDCLTQALSIPWKLFNKVWGSANVLWGGTDVLAWGTPLPLKIAHWVTWKMGIALHHAFTLEVTSFMFDAIALTEEKTCAAFLALHRSGEDGLLQPNRSMEKLFDMVKQTFRDTKFEREDVIFTCSKPNSLLFRGMFSKLMHGNLMKDTIQEEVEAALNRWTTECSGGKFINATSETRRLASNIITRVLFGQKVNNLKLCDAVNFINEFTLKDLSGRATAKDRGEYAENLQIFREETEKILKGSETIPLLGERNLSDAQEKALVFVTFFAGQETVASLINNTLFELGKKPAKAERLEKDTLEDFFVRSIHDFTPAYGVGRKVKNDLCLLYTLEGEEEPRKLVFLKDSLLSARMSAVAEATILPEEGELSRELPWKPFGAGHHNCPGRVLAEEEFTVFFDQLKAGYKIKLQNPKQNPRRVGHITLQLTEDIFLNIERK